MFFPFSVFCLTKKNGKGMEKRINSFFQGMGMGINSFFKSRNEEWELIPFFEWEWEWDYNPKNQGMDPSRVSRGLFNSNEMTPMRTNIFEICLTRPFQRAIAQTPKFANC